MREVWAIIRRDRLKKTKEMVDSIGAGAMTISSVLGRGRQSGLPMSATSIVDEAEVMVRRSGPAAYIPKKIITMVIPALMVREVVDAIISVNRTGSHGDGKIFVMPVDEAVRVRTGESGIAAVDYSE